MTALLVATLAFGAALLAPRVVPHDRAAPYLDRAQRALERFGAAAAAVLSALVVWWVWGQLVPVPVVHDESSYLLQSEIFARGRWTAPTPPIPEFFEQPHVQVVPAVASKYPPGHALVLAIGTLVGFPTLMPLLLTGVTAALLFALTARVTNVWVALVAWVLWISAPIVLRFQPSYYSELTTTTMLLASWWTLLEWRGTRRTRWLLLTALAIGWGAITRPLTMLALAVPIGIVVVRDVVRLRLWRQLGAGLAVGCAVLALLPLWSSRTTGDWRLSPQELYRRDYFPFDQLGFTPDSTAPRRAESMSKVLMYVYDNVGEMHRRQRLNTLPENAGLRALSIADGFFRGARLPLLLFLAVGLLAGGAFRFAALSVLAQFLAYLLYAHHATWTLYYLETAPAIAALTGMGLWHVARRFSSERGAPLGVLCATLVLAGFAVRDLPWWRAEHHRVGAFYRDFARSVKELPRPGILFVRYSARLRESHAVVRNFADPNSAPLWIVHDLGARNADLMRLAPARTVHHFDEDRIIRDR